MSLCQSRITTSSSMPLTFNFLQGFLAALRSSVPVSCLLIFLKFNKTRKPQVTIQLKRQTSKFKHKSCLQFLNIQYKYTSIYVSCDPKRSQRINLTYENIVLKIFLYPIRVTVLYVKKWLHYSYITHILLCSPISHLSQNPSIYASVIN